MGNIANSIWFTDRPFLSVALRPAYFRDVTECFEIGAWPEGNDCRPKNKRAKKQTVVETEAGSRLGLRLIFVALGGGAPKVIGVYIHVAAGTKSRLGESQAV